ncbi:hypothetical protein [Shumkonia mesophila]|uniref:hypothetical protein n=1 Tax=Shumkonia mesophila TaxID=2838854 RepID=UPI0029351745|nr:hypothetical protein [Shumkonia mesophila]
MPIVALILILVAAAMPAASQTMCAARAELLGDLQGKFAEAPVAIGLTNAGGLVEVLTSPGGDTWTLIVTDAQGTSCLVAAGESWERLDPPAPGERT